MCDNDQRSVVGEQRPTYTGSFRDAKITLHDDVFLDNDENEPMLNKILTLYEQAHCTLILILRRILSLLYLFNSKHWTIIVIFVIASLDAELVNTHTHSVYYQLC